MPETDVLQYRRSDSGDDFYEGWSVPGTKENQKGWLIRLSISDGTNVISRDFAQNKVNFSLVWKARELYSYGP
jgi:hypothetical protein